MNIKEKILKEDFEFIINQDLPWDKLANSTVLISGGNGFLARYLTETLLYLNDYKNLNIKIISMVRSIRKHPHCFKVSQSNRVDLQFLRHDVRLPLDTQCKIDYVIHCASHARPEFYTKDPVGTIESNIKGTINLLELSRKNKIKGFLFFSTGGVLGRMDEDKMPSKESDYGYIDPLDLNSSYSESKRMAETICASWSAQYNIPARIVRPSYVYGPGFSPKDERVVPKFISRSIKNLDLNINCNKTTRSFLYISDATVAFFTVLLKAKRCEAFNVSSKREEPLLNLANLLLSIDKQSSSKIIKQKKKSKSPVVRSAFCIKKIQALGWNPTTDLEEGLKRTMMFHRGQN